MSLAASAMIFFLLLLSPWASLNFGTYSTSSLLDCSSVSWTHSGDIEVLKKVNGKIRAVFEHEPIRLLIPWRCRDIHYVKRL